MHIRSLASGLVLLGAVAVLWAGVSKEIEEEYKARYENRALFLRRPVWSSEQAVLLPEGEVSPTGLLRRPLFRVTDQVRITRVNFKDSEVEFELSSIDLSRRAKVVFRFPQSLSYTFSQRSDFDRALESWFTEGLTYKDLEETRRQYIQQEFRKTLEILGTTSGAEASFVREAVADAHPDFAETRRRLQEASEELKAVRAAHNELEQRAAALERELREARTRLDHVSTSAAEAEREREALIRERNSLRADLDRLRRDSESSAARMKELSDRLNLELGSNTQLSQQLEALSRRIGELTRAHDEAQKSNAELRRQVEQLTKEKEQLTRELQETGSRLQRAQAQLQALTSDRNSLEARFLALQEAHDDLVVASELSQSLRLRPAWSDTDGGALLKSEVWLQRQVLGELELFVPSSEGSPVRLVFRSASPNLVQFSDEERRLYAALGDSLQVSARLKPWNEELVVEQVLGEVEQAIRPREEGRWEWALPVGLNRPEGMTLRLSLKTVGGSTVGVGDIQLTATPASWWYRLTSSWSWLSLAVGGLAGLLVGWGVGRRRRQPDRPPNSNRKASTPSTVVKKGL